MANVESIILSKPENGIDGYGLSEKGKTQARVSAQKFTKLNNETVIYSSDFKRAKETAEITASVIGVNQVHFTDKLRERNFGDYEKKHNTHYDDVWKIDANDPNHTHNNVESVNSVMKRATELIIELEKQYNNKNILLVAHGDTLQILSTAFEKLCGSKHRTIQHLEVAEIRELKLSNN